MKFYGSLIVAAIFGLSLVASVSAVEPTKEEANITDQPTTEIVKDAKDVKKGKEKDEKVSVEEVGETSVDNK
ncbi:MAG: hypothetical protein LBL17_02285 [Coxiellaceae bacterium]|nr:hypothetical protein [Coxiellaceae bacterium]